MLPSSSRSLPKLVILLWLTFQVAAYPGMVKKVDTDPRARLWRSKELANAIKDMRQGDYKLVRPSISKETEIEQHKYCPYKLNSFIMSLCTSTAGGRSLGKMAVCLHRRGLAAETIALCLTDQPQFRNNAANATFLTEELNPIQQSELVAHSLAEGLYVLLKDGLKHQLETKDGGSLLAMAQAAEAVWISAFHHPGHIQNYLDIRMIDLLGEIIVTFRPDSFGQPDGPKLEHGYVYARAVMWAMAALQNLAANYCDNELGYCIWEWSESGKLVLDDETRLDAPELADQARAQIAAVPNLIETIAEWVCQGPIHARVNETYGWPGDSITYKDLTFNAMSPHMHSPSIVPWAATGVIKNLLLGKNDPALQERIHNLPHLSECLCALERSPDYLEQGKSTEAIFRWSPDWEGLCPDIYATCQDDSNWENAESGDSCAEYDKERWCVEYGEDVDANGKTAKEACCACGGGYPKESLAAGEGQISSDENATSEQTAPDSSMGDSLGESTVDIEAGDISEDPAADASSHDEF